MILDITKLRPLAELEQEAHDTYKERINNELKWAAQTRDSRIKRFGENRLALGLLIGAGLDTLEIHTDSWSPEYELSIQLGNAFDVENKTKRTTKADLAAKEKIVSLLKDIATALQGHFEEDGRELECGDKQIVRVSLKHSKFPGVRVQYFEKIANDPKLGLCKIVRRVERKARVTYSLECPS